MSRRPSSHSSANLRQATPKVVATGIAAGWLKTFGSAISAIISAETKNDAESTSTTLVRPSQAMSMPPSDGPMRRVTESLTAFSEFAPINSFSSTKFGMMAFFAGTKNCPMVDWAIATK